MSGSAGGRLAGMPLRSPIIRSIPACTVSVSASLLRFRGLKGRGLPLNGETICSGTLPRLWSPSSSCLDMEDVEGACSGCRLRVADGEQFLNVEDVEFRFGNIKKGFCESGESAPESHDG